uniref:UNC93-like protein n=1 Tax=Styela clava TaxID=7725 RepID=UPI00193ACB28|nr:UNC93-like protein [Styela clava]
MKDESSTAKLRSIRNQFFGYLLGMFLTFSSYGAILNLQSSINIEDGLGTISISASYIACDLFLVFFTTILIRKYGVKKCLIASEITYMIYIVTNLYPEFYTLIPAAILVGAGEGTIWPCMTIINFYFATKFATERNHESKGNDFYVNLYSGYFFTCLQCCQIFGNLVAYAVLYAFNDPLPSDTYENGHNFTTVLMETTISDFNNLEYCGSHDCQDITLVDGSLNQYVPTNDKTLIILISILTFMCLMSIFSHYYFVPNDVTISFVSETYDAELSKTINPQVNQGFEIENHNNHEDVNQSDSRNTEIQQNVCDMTVQLENDSEITIKETIKKSSTVKISMNQDSSSAVYETDSRSDGAYIEALKDLGKQMLKTSQLLLIPITFYLGLTQGFIFSELTRAFSSCVVGVEMVGIHMATFGFSDAVLSYIVGKYGQKLGRTPFFILSMVVDLCSYSYCLLWDPNLESAWSIFLIYFAFGVSDGIWQTLLNVLYIEYFEGSHDVAITTWAFWITAGFATQFGWSTSLCVYIKIYVQIGMLILGMFGYDVAAYLQRKKRMTDSFEFEETRL